MSLSSVFMTNISDCRFRLTSLGRQKPIPIENRRLEIGNPFIRT
jgi:hypothetical protein